MTVGREVFTVAPLLLVLSANCFATGVLAKDAQSGDKEIKPLPVVRYISAASNTNAYKVTPMDMTDPIRA